MLDLIKNSLSRENLEKISKNKNEPEWLLERRLENFYVFESLPEPDFIYGLSIILDRSQINLGEIDPLSGQENIQIKTNHRIIIKDLHEALKTHEDIIKIHLLKNQPKNKFEALASAFWTGGLFIYLPKNTEIEMPAEIYSNLISQSCIQTILVIAEPFSKISIIESQESQREEKSYRFQNIEIFGKESSKIEFSSIQNNRENVINFSFRKAFIEKDASVHWNICDLGGLFTKSDVTTSLIGQGASVNNIGIFLGKRNQQFDFSANAIHLAPNTSSELLTKGALSDKSKGVYGGLIKITPEGTKSSGHQKVDILLLSKEAEAAPIPNLEIETNDVKKCSHAASVGQVDKEKLFYLMSRGLSEKEASNQIVKGLLEPAIQKIKIEKVQKHLRNLIEERLS